MLKRLLADDQAESNDHDDASRPVPMADRQNSVLLLLVAFAWGVLATGMLVGGTLIQRMPFGDFLLVSFTGNAISLIVGCLAGYIGYSTGQNTGLTFRKVYGVRGSQIVVLLIAILATGWHSVVVGAMGFAWAQSTTTLTFVIAGALGGLLITVSTMFGIKALERLAIPKSILLLSTGIYASWLQISQLGGWDAFLTMAAKNTDTSASYLDSINFVVGSWIVGAIVMAEYTRFARNVGVAIGIPLTALMIAQWLVQIFGAIGVASGGSYDFIAFLMGQSAVLGAVGILTMTISLWVSGSANLYFPGVQVAAAVGKSRRLMTLIIGLIGTIGAFGLYTHFEAFIGILGNIAPPIIGPVIAEFYIIRKGRAKDFADIAEVNFRAPAFCAFVGGAAITFVAPPNVLPALLGLIVSLVVYLVIRLWQLRQISRRPA